jgi:acyl dehydratase
MVRGKLFGEFEVGDSYTTVWKTVMEGHLTQFIGLTQLEEPLFEDKQFLDEETQYDDWIVPGLLTMSMALGLFSRSGWLEDTGLALMNLDASFDAPVHVGDAIRVDIEVVDTHPTSREDGGVIELEWDIHTREGGTAITVESAHFIRKAE